MAQVILRLLPENSVQLGFARVRRGGAGRLQLSGSFLDKKICSLISQQVLPNLLGCTRRGNTSGGSLPRGGRASRLLTLMLVLGNGLS